MQSLSKLSISGVRSYSPDHDLQIKILGSNGSGKTTVIECLKFVCTGQFPPLSDHGKSFVHDPKMAGRAEVRAKIQLLFRTVDRRVVMVNRLFQVKLKRTGKMEYKALDSVIRTKRPGEDPVSNSHRCADMDKLVPQLMGVSQAVIDNVIFCHQEDSNWPLSESKVLKDRFDDIFAATHYTKALDAIRKYRKEKLKQLKDQEADLRELTAHLEVASDLRARLADTKEALVKIQTEVRQYKERERELNQGLQDMRSIKDNALAMQREIGRLRDRARLMRVEMEQSKGRIGKRYKGTEAELKDLLTTAKARKGQWEHDLTEVNTAIAAAQQRIKTNSAKHRETLRLLGSAEAEQRAHAERVTQLVQMVQAASDEYKLGIDASKLRGRDDGLDEGVASDFERAMQRQAERCRAELEQHQADARDQLASVEELCRNAGRAVADKKAQAKVALQDAERLRAEAASIATKLASVDERAGDLDRLEHELSERQEALRAIEGGQGEDSESKRLADKMSTARAEWEECNTRMSALAAERKEAQAKQEAALRLKEKRVQLERRETRAKAQLEGNAAAIRMALGIDDGEELPAADVLLQRARDAQAEVRAAAARKDSELQAANKDRDRLAGQLNVNERELERMQARCDKIERELQSKGLKDLENPNFERKIESASRKLQKAVERAALPSSATALYNIMRDSAKSEMCCPLCLTRFEDSVEQAEAAVAALLEDGGEDDDGPELTTGTLATLLYKCAQALESASPEKQAQLQEAKKKEEKRLGKLRAAQAQWVEYNDYRARAAKLEDALAQMRAAGDEAKAAASTLREEADALKARDDMIGQVLNLLLQQQHELEETAVLRREMAELRRQLGQNSDTESDDDDASPLERVQQKEEEVQRRLVELNREMQEVSQQQATLRQRIDRARARVDSTRSKVDELKTALADRDRLRRAQKEAKAKAKAREAEAQEHQAGVGELEQREATAQRQRRKLNDAQQATARELETRLSSVSASLDNVKAFLGPIRRFIDGAARRAQMKRDLEEAARDRQSAEAAVEAGMERRSELQTKLSEQSTNEADVRANLDYMERKRALRELKGDLEKKVIEHNELVGEGAELQGDMEAQEREWEEAKAKVNRCKGQFDAMRTQQADLQEQLSAATYADIDARHMEKKVQHMTTRYAAEDLDKYAKALDKALMQFHALKMEEINEVLREYWQVTYQGNDIDSIAIVADHKGDLASGRRQYDYRVVMRTGDNELNMRGRCSAGQKVLTCLLIRLALAETFCSSCGVLALDEPTTNLDIANIRSFALALSAIIQKRRNQKNFQLIVITHDKDFIEMLGRDNADHFYRVFKDGEHSNIQREPM